MSSEQQAPLWEHLHEMRQRLVRVIIFFVMSFICFWVFRHDLLNAYMLPMKGLLESVSGEVILLRVVDRFFIHLKTCLFASVLATLPFAMWEIWRFVAPGLHASERRQVCGILLLAPVLFYGGIAFAYGFVIPIGMRFFVDYSSQDEGFFMASPLSTRLGLSLSEHVSLTQSFLLVFGMASLLPLAMMLVSKAGFVDVNLFRKYRRHGIVICFVAAAVLTPPDPLTMVALGFPLVVLYELGIWLSRASAGCCVTASRL